MRRTPLFLVGALSIASAATLLAAENAVVLESFEDNIDAVALGDWGGSRIVDEGVAFSQYTRADAEDIYVTHGEKSLQIDLTGSEGWVHDFKITLSDEASETLLEAARSTDVARYILRYDFVFPPGTAWMNNQVFLGTLNDQLDSPGSSGGMRTMSIALDLINGLPEEGPVVIRFADNFDATEDPFVGLTVYVDNLRLVDTYAPGATPVVTLLQGFEDAANPTGGATEFTGWGGTPRTTYSQYTRTDPEDIRVTEGDHALQVDYAGAGTWNADFTLPFADTKLAEVLRLDLPPEERPTPEELARYTLRFDVTYPDRGDDGTPNWGNTAYHTLAAGFPYSQARIDASLGQQQTVSITLDQLESWSDTVEGAPVLMFVANSDWSEPGSTLYYDNFRLIDTGGASTPPGDAINISSVQFNRSTSTITLQWNSTAGTNYAIDYTQNLGSWPTVLAASVPGTAGTTTYTGVVPAGERGFLRVRPAN